MDAAPVSAVLRTFIADWGQSRAPASRYDPADRAVPRISAVEWIAAETAHHRARVELPGLGVDKIEQLAAERSRYRHVELRDADVLLIAIGRSDLLGELPVYPNEQAGAAARARCVRASASREFRQGMIEAASALGRPPSRSERGLILATARASSSCCGSSSRMSMTLRRP